MKSQVLHTVWCYITGEAAGEIGDWSLLGLKGLSWFAKSWARCLRSRHGLSPTRLKQQTIRTIPEGAWVSWRERAHRLRRTFHFKSFDEPGGKGSYRRASLVSLFLVLFLPLVRTVGTFSHIPQGFRFYESLATLGFAPSRHHSLSSPD